MKQLETYNRTESLKGKLNDFLHSITNDNIDYFSKLSNHDLIRLKLALSDVNNVITLKATLAFSKWMVDFFKLSDEIAEKLLSRVDLTKPNTNGFDIEFPEGKIIAEIKCLIPINGGSFFGSAQRNEILDDANKLMFGCRSLPDTKDYYKIIGLVNHDERTHKAIINLLKEVKNSRTQNPKTQKRNDIIKYLMVLDDNLMNSDDLTADYVFIKPIML